MALKDVLDSLTGKNRHTEPEDTGEAASALMASDLFPIFPASNVDQSRYRKIPLAGVAALGAAFSQLPDAARTVVKRVTTNVATKETLFIGVNPKGVEGFLRANENGTTGNILQVNEQGKTVIKARMRFKPLENGLPVTKTTATTIPFDPTSLVVAAALVRVEQKLAELQQTAEDILQFLELEKQSRQRGNLNLLSEIHEDYKRRYGDERLRLTRGAAILDVMREAHQDMLFYQEQIARQLRAQTALHGAQMAQTMLESVTSAFREYQLACYLYAFASFLDVMLQMDFTSAAIETAAKRMDECAGRYGELYAACRAQLAAYLKTSFEAQLLGGLGSAAKSVGKKLAAIPLLSGRGVNDTLVNAGESLEAYNRDALAQRLEAFAPLEDCRMRTFRTALGVVDSAHNREGGMLTDGESLYLLDASPATEKAAL